MSVKINYIKKTVKSSRLIQFYLLMKNLILKYKKIFISNQEYSYINDLLKKVI